MACAGCFEEHMQEIIAQPPVILTLKSSLAVFPASWCHGILSFATLTFDSDVEDVGFEPAQEVNWCPTCSDGGARTEIVSRQPSRTSHNSSQDLPEKVSVGWRWRKRCNSIHKARDLSLRPCSRRLHWRCYQRPCQPALQPFRLLLTFWYVFRGVDVGSKSWLRAWRWSGSTLKFQDQPWHYELELMTRDHARSDRNLEGSEKSKGLTEAYRSEPKHRVSNFFYWDLFGKSTGEGLIFRYTMNQLFEILQELC